MIENIPGVHGQLDHACVLSRQNEEEMAATVTETTAKDDPIFRYFAYSHLPAILQNASKPFYDLAMNILLTIPRCAERTVALRKLLESKDAAVRAALP